MITKGIKQEAKIAVSYTLKHFYAMLTPVSDNATIRFFSQIYDFDLINHLIISGEALGDIVGASGTLTVKIDDDVVDTEENISDKDEIRIELDCTAISGEKTLELRLLSGEAGKVLTMWELAIYPMSQAVTVPV